MKTTILSGPQVGSGRYRRQLCAIMMHLCCAYLWLPPSATAESPTIIVGEQGKRLDDYCEKRERHGFSGTVLMATDGEVVLQNGYGFANREAKTPNAPDTLFEIASLAKQFTATAILTLEQEGRLSTDDPISTHLPGVPAAYRSVSVYQLLTHTGGLPQGGSGRGLNLVEAVRQHLAEPPRFRAGERYVYSNVDYALLAGIVETASGKRFEDYCRAKLFEPAGLSHTGFCGEAFDVEHVALGYSRDEPKGRRPQQDPYPPDDVFGYEYRGMGGVITSVTDLYRWVKALGDETVVPRSVTNKLFTPHLGNYACGWEVFDFSEGRKCIGHGGAVAGFVCKLWMFPDERAVMIVLSNHDSFDYRMLNDLKAILFDERPGPRPTAVRALRQPESTPPIHLDDTYLRSLEGEYHAENQFKLRLRIAVKDDGIQAELIPPADLAARKPKERHAAQTEEIFAGLVLGNASALGKYMNPQIPSSWPARMETAIWPRHLENWGELTAYHVMAVEQRPFQGKPCTFVWMRLRHEQGDCLALTTFLPDEKLQLLVLDAGEYFCRSSSDGIFLPYSQTEFYSNPKDLRMNAIHREGKDRILVSSRGITLAFER